ncbi:uncharacterized protein N7498_009929 [Penicillium cinerascens]|uniref:F-box domain-containing protein n=1 Tax=Penicillium cinerascens TaxID=70096 RepID=A0A9W9M6W8_9EURO|nr:uncharacterized protein N7498_009929 [Penicillium cinerascens]KAJ5190944.1 hypothetical protein N7498_009929 [Penicillium cinerascens]
MEKLPPEIIQFVTGLLDQHPPSFRAFACVNWGCYYAAPTYLFHTLHFKEQEKKDVIDLAEKYSQQLKQTSAFQHVRFVSIEDNLDSEMSKKSALSQQYQFRVATDIQPLP